MVPESAFSKALMQGSMWMIGARWATRLVGLVSTIILARLLAPADFGIIAMALIAAGFLETISYAGVDLALMRAGNNSRAHYDTAWTIQLIQAAIVAALLMVVAPIASSFFSEPRATAVIQLLALKSLIDGAQNIGVVAFRKELDFAKEFRFMLYSKLLNFTIVVGLAYGLRSYWALAIGSVTAGMISVGLSYAMHPYRPKLSLARTREIWSFSQWLMISRVGAFLNRRADEFLIGSSIGTSAMGGYHVASELSTMPSSELVMPMRRAMFPTLSTLKTGSSEFSAAVVSTFSIAATVCLGIAVGIMSIAPEIVRLILGEKWISVIPLVQWLSIFGGFSALVLVLEVPLWVAGKTHLSAAQTWLELLILVPLLFFAIHYYGVEGAAATRAGVALLMVPMMIYLTVRGGYVKISDLLSALTRPVIASAAMASVLVLTPFSGSVPLIVIMVSKILVGAIVYITVLVSLWYLQGRPEGIEASLIRQARRLLFR